MEIYPLFRHRMLAPLACAAFMFCAATASAKVVHDSSDQAMAHRYGRAGQITGSQAVDEPAEWRRNGDPVGISYDEGYAQRTNMPRSERHEGPVSDRTPPDVLHG